MTQFSQLVQVQVALSSQPMVVPTISKCIQVILQVWNKNKVAAEEVCRVGDAQEPLLFKVVQDILINAINSYPQVSPQPLNPKF